VQAVRDAGGSKCRQYVTQKATSAGSTCRRRQQVQAVHDAGGSKCRQYVTQEAASAGST
jgi:hypothetical protein